MDCLPRSQFIVVNRLEAIHKYWKAMKYSVENKKKSHETAN